MQRQDRQPERAVFHGAFCEPGKVCRVCHESRVTAILVVDWRWVQAGENDQMAVLASGCTQPMNLISQLVFSFAYKSLAGNCCSATNQYFSPLDVILLLQCKQGVLVACLISQGAVMESCRGEHA